MGVFRQFPYSNFHEMNMDIIIKTIKNMIEEWALYHAQWDEWMEEINEDWETYQTTLTGEWDAYKILMNKAWKDMQDWITDYFDNLDVQEEINTKIVSMIQTGEFGLLVNEYIPPAVNAWLNANITEPEGVVIDTSLSVAGACADAKATGDKIKEVTNEIGDMHSVYSAEHNIGFCDFFYHGVITNGDFAPGAIYRVSNNNIIEIFDDVKLHIADGYRAYVFLFEDGVYTTSTGWLTDTYIIPKGKGFKVMIAETVDDYYTEADISAFVAAITFDNIFVNKINDIETSMDNASIEGYSRNYPEIIGTEYNNYIIGGSGNMITLSGWNVLEVNVTAGEKYLISGTGNPLYVLKVNNVVVDFASVSPASQTDYPYTATATGQLFVNCQNGHALIKHKTGFSFVKGADILAQQTGGTSYAIGKDNYIYNVDLTGSSNGLFNFTSLIRNGVTFKNVADDITPISFGGAGYVGANHGYYFGYNLTITNHGLVTTDIGKTYVDGTNTWVLIKIIDVNTIQVICYDSSVWYRMKTETVPDTVNFGMALSVESSTLTQIRPCVINTNVEIVENTSEYCTIAENYDIIDIGTGIAYLMSHVGSNTNDTICDQSDGIVTVRNMYEFINNGACTIYQNLKLLKNVAISSYGGVQSGSFTASGDYFAVPLTSFTYQAVSATERFIRSTWNTNNVPPTVYMQTDGAAGTRAMILGYIGENRNSNIYNSAGWINGDGQKMYPYLINPDSAGDSGDIYNAISFRMPCYLNEIDNNIAYVSYIKVYKDYYLFISVDDVTNTPVYIPKTLWNKKAEVYMSDGITTNTEYIIDAVDIVSTGRGYLILKLSD